MTTRIPSLMNTRFLGRVAPLALAFGLLVAGIAKSEAATVIDFTPGETKTSVDFSGLATGASVGTLSWTGSTGGFVGAAARASASAPNSQVLQVIETTRQQVVSPAFTSPFAASETAYFQGSMNRIASSSSGARIALRAGGTNLIGFGMMDTSGNAFAMLANGVWHTSSETNNANKWYELRLVIDVNANDIALSVGHLFVRNVTDGETEFRLLDGLSNINLGFTETNNLSNITNWRIESARYDAQIGNLIGGVGTMVVPEPKVAAILGVMALLGFSPKFRRLFRRH